MYKDYRINTNINSGDKVLKVNLKQGIDTFKILSLEINREDAYQLHTSNYGVIVGRVLANNSFGVPNVKVSVFVPISSADESNSIISSEYPYKTVQSVDSNNKKYNLLLDEGYSSIESSHDPIGTFPNKRLVLDNDGEVEVYDKYWKYTTTTNDSGDYMLFGVPTGTCQVHYDCDLSDIGLISQKPYDFIQKGYSASLFKSPTEFNDDDASKSIYVLSQDKTIYVYPFWGDEDANKIGITRNDIDLNYTFEPSCIFMGSSITDSQGTYINTYGYPNGNNGRFSSLSTSSGNIEIIRKTQDGRIEEVKENVQGIIDGNGVWCYPIPMNLDRIGTDEEGNTVTINDPTKGIPTRARVRMRVSLTNVNDDSTGEYSAKILIPNNPPLSQLNNGAPKINSDKVSDADWTNYYEFGSKTPDSCFRDMYWGKIYSVKQYYPRITYGTENLSMDSDYNANHNSEEADYSNYPLHQSAPFSCISSIDSINGFNPFPYTTMYCGAENINDNDTTEWFKYHLSDSAGNSNYSSKGIHFCFENDWVNGCIYFPKVRITKSLVGEYDYFGKLNDNGSTYVNKVYYTGRHDWLYDGNYTTREAYVDKYAAGNKGRNLYPERTSCHSYVKLPIGLLTKKTTLSNKSVFYYRCGGESVRGDKFYRLYATDIILLGNITNIYDSLPLLVENLPSTTTVFPPIVPPQDMSESGMNMNAYRKQLDLMFNSDYDRDEVDMFGDYVKWTNAYNYFGSGAQGEYLQNSGENWDGFNYSQEDNSVDSENLFYDSYYSSDEHVNEEGKTYKYTFDVIKYVLDRTSLFFGLKAYDVDNYLHYFTQTFVNTSRICELDVQNDHTFKSLNKNYHDYCASNYEVLKDSLGKWNFTLNSVNYRMPINGMIDRFDITSNKNRSAFASMNYDVEKYVIDPKTKRRKYIPSPMYLVDFDGRLSNYCRVRNFYLYDERADETYIQFRFGTTEKPLTYPNMGITDEIFYNDDLIMPENSFYFYFGLNSGFSAIDVFKSKFYSNNNDESVDTLLEYYVEPISTYNNTTKEITTSLTVYVPDTFTGNITYYLYKNNSYLSKGVTTSTSITFSKLLKGIYKIEIEDESGSYATKTISLDPTQIPIKFTKSGNAVTFTSILNVNNPSFNGIDESTVRASARIGEKNTYIYIRFNTPYTMINRLGNTITFPKGTNVVYGTIYVEGFENYTTIIGFSFDTTTELVTTFCNVPISLLYPWNSPVTWSWTSLDTANANASNLYIKLEMRKYTEAQQRLYVSKMVSSVFDNEPMTLTYNGSDSGSYKNVCISPITSTIDIDNTDAQTLWKSSLNNGMLYSVNGIANNDSNLPQLVGQNYPTGIHSYSGIRCKKDTVYSINNTLKYDYNGSTVSGSYNYFAAINWINHAEHVGVGDETSKNDDIPTDVKLCYITNTRGFFPSSGYTGYFNIQTVDKRLDYEIALMTPSVLPSGYNKFPKLKDKTIVGGKLDGYIYGGLRFDYDDTDNKLTTYQLDSTGVLSGSPTSNAILFRDYVYEDAEPSGGTKSNKISGNITKNSLKIWASNYNDSVHYYHTNPLSGNTSLDFDLVSCSGNFSNGYVKGGNRLRLTFSYESGIELVHGTIYDEDYDVLYTVSSGDNTLYLASLSGSSLTFTLQGDSLYGGNTYTDIKTDGLRGDKTKTLGDSNNYPTWAQIFSSNYGCNDSRHELSLLRYSGINTEATEAYDIKIKSEDSSSYNDFAYDESKFFPYYKDKSSQETIMLTDSELSNIYTFGIGDNANTKTFDAYDYLLIPTRKLYQENKNTLLHQAMVYKSGVVYYASRILVTKDENTIYVQLYSPLLSNEGKVNFNSEALTGSLGCHTIGDITSYYAAGNSVTYDADSLKFTITCSQTSGILPFYFIIEGGLKYKVNIKLD